MTTVGSGTATIDTIGSDFDTLLEVFTGPALDSLTFITCNDDDPSLQPGWSRVTFAVAASTTYYIRASGPFNATGNLVITGNRPPAGSPDLTTAVTDSADPVALGGDNLTYTVVVVNNGTAAAAGITVTTTLSGASAAIVSASSTQFPCTISAPTVTCPLNGLAVSQSATITVTVSPNATGTITATAVSTLNETDANPADNTDTPGTDTMSGGLGGDSINVADGTGGDTANGGLGTDTCTTDPADTTTSC